VIAKPATPESLVRNQATLTGRAISPTTASPVDTTVDRAPHVTAVYANSSGWTPADAP
jgi:hypothetical protein